MMQPIRFEQSIRQLEKRQGGYYYLLVDAAVVDQFTRKRATRLLCSVDQKLVFRCGLNHLGDGNFYIIVSTANLTVLGKLVGDPVSVELTEDPNPLGVDMPDVLQVLLDQDDDARLIFDRLTDGKKRSLIYALRPIKDIDKQVQKILTFLHEQSVKRR